VPLLVDGDLKLTEGSAILKYIAEKYQLSSYPADLKKRAKINEVMDWLNTGFYRDFGYNLVYSQLFPHHKRRSDEAHAGTIAWGKEGSKKWLQLLNDHWIGPTNQYLCGNEITIADYFGACMVTIGDLVGCDLSAYPNVQRWLANMNFGQGGGARPVREGRACIFLRLLGLGLFWGRVRDRACTWSRRNRRATIFQRRSCQIAGHCASHLSLRCRRCQQLTY
jgi:glutathione S-transferase